MVIRKGGWTIARNEAMAHVTGYSILNDGSVRDWQHMIDSAVVRCAKHQIK